MSKTTSPAAKTQTTATETAPRKVREADPLKRKSVRQVLAVLAKAKGPMTRTQIADKVMAAGEVLSKDRIADEKGTYEFLLGAKLATEKMLPKAGWDGVDKDYPKARCYELTAKGREAAKTVGKAPKKVKATA